MAGFRQAPAHYGLASGTVATMRLGFAVCCGLCLVGIYFSWN